jgi:hypothetical protein
MMATIVLAGGLLASAAQAQVPTDLEKQLADLRTQVPAVDKQLSERQTYLKAQAPVAALVTTAESAEAAFAALRKTEKVAAIETAKNKASGEYNKLLEEAKKGSAEYTALRAKEKDAHTRQQAADITPEAKATISKELADVKKQKEELLKTLKEQPAVVAAKSADEAAIKAYQDMTKEAEYVKLQQARDEARNAMNKAVEEAKKGDASYNEIKTKREYLHKQECELGAQMKAAQATK